MTKQLAGSAILAGAALMSLIGSIIAVVILYYTCMKLGLKKLFYGLILSYVIAVILYIIGYSIIAVDSVNSLGLH